ncbi:MAG: LptF/LptG family permease [Phycisphaerae bacterium]|nr:LptF/LptG family permease [Phycisphaerae bacterium]
MTILDRYILRSLLINYLIALGVMISLYVVLDLFVNMDEFTEQRRPIGVTMLNMASYYGPHVFVYFAQLSGVIALFACMATIARMRRQNELTAMLASGVSLYRVAAPILGFGLATTALLILDTEVLTPRVAHLLARDHDDVDGTRAYGVYFLPDRNGALVSAGRFYPRTQDLRQLLVLRRTPEGNIAQTIEADRATWEPPTPQRRVGRWVLERGIQRTRTEHAAAGLGPTGERFIEPVSYYESDLSPVEIELRQSEGWIRYLSLGQLKRLQESGLAERDLAVQTRHARVTAPIVGMVLLLLGLPFFLDRSPASVLTDTTKCLVVCGMCYASMFVAQSVRTAEASALPSWIPIFIFATLAMVLIDRVRT